MGSKYAYFRPWGLKVKEIGKKFLRDAVNCQSFESFELYFHLKNREISIYEVPLACHYIASTVAQYLN